MKTFYCQFHGSLEPCLDCGPDLQLSIDELETLIADLHKEHGWKLIAMLPDIPEPKDAPPEEPPG